MRIRIGKVNNVNSDPFQPGPQNAGHVRVSWDDEIGKVPEDDTQWAMPLSSTSDPAIHSSASQGKAAGQGAGLGGPTVGMMKGSTVVAIELDDQTRYIIGTLRQSEQDGDTKKGSPAPASKGKEHKDYSDNRLIPPDDDRTDPGKFKDDPKNTLRSYGMIEANSAQGQKSFENIQDWGSDKNVGGQGASAGNGPSV